ncbi:hypothetical protein ACFLYT_01270, partial [Nanoarchaeota archaeon]
KRALIPAQKKESGGEEYTTPAIDLPPPHMWGGVKISEIIIKPKKLYEYSEIEFVVLSLPDPTMSEHMQWLSEIESESEEYEKELKPKFKKWIDSR